MKNRRGLLIVPYVGWMTLFVVAPIIIVVVYAFTAAAGGAEIQFAGQTIHLTLDNFARMGTYTTVFIRSFKLAIIATLICLLIGYPLAYVMAKEGPRFQRIAMVLIMLPLWMNFLLRTYAWMSLLENNGLLNQLFSAIGVVDLGNSINAGLNSVCVWLNDGLISWLNSGPLAGINSLFGSDLALAALNTARPTDQTFFRMLFTQGAVVLGMVYNYLPFMVLPIYSVLLKMDNSLVEAARDLGANTACVFRKVIFPLSLPGVLSGVTMVFVPAVSTFAISKMLGGGTQLMLGDLIEMLFMGSAYNPNLGAAISMVMMVIVVLCMVIMNRFGEGEEQAVML